MLRLAKFTNAHAKLTFLGMGSAEGYPFRDLHEPCRKIIAVYTPDRCVWGSDFPCELWTPKTTYSQNLRVFTDELGLEMAAKEAILGKTARRLYFRGKLG
jgi:predicted TIM-barrel fold metal-dependent hydrolase